MGFYPEAMRKSHVRIASVRIKNGVSHSTGHAIMDLVNQYQREMRADAEIAPDDNRRLEFWYADPFREAVMERIYDVTDSLDLLMARGPISVN